jgi:hypothetical protein
MKEGITYEIICRKRLNRVECPFKKQDPELHCANCSFAGFVERKREEWDKEPIQEENKNDIKTDG